MSSRELLISAAIRAAAYLDCVGARYVGGTASAASTVRRPLTATVLAASAVTLLLTGCRHTDEGSRVAGWSLVEPTGGGIRINGYGVARQPGLVRQRLGAALTGERSVYWGVY